MVWVSADGVWQVRLADFGDFCWVEIARAGVLAWCGMVPLWRAWSGVDAPLAGLNGPRLDQLRELP